MYERMGTKQTGFVNETLMHPVALS